MADDSPLMTLEDFCKRAEAEIGAFAVATQRMRELGQDGFVGEEYELRDLADWCRELAAYMQFVELSEETR